VAQTAQIGRAEDTIFRLTWGMRLLRGSGVGRSWPGPLTFVGSNRWPTGDLLVVHGKEKVYGSIP